MDYELAVEGAPATVPGGTGILLLHPSTGETDRIDTDFLKQDTDAFLVISTRTTAREVQQKLEHYGVDRDKAVILDTLSVERGYSRRQAENIHYVSAPDDLDGIVSRTESFLASTSGKRRISVDSITELAYYADEPAARRATERLLGLLATHDAVGLFHLSPEVHDDAVVESYEAMFDGVVELAEDGSVSARF
ncbi:MAG: ATPase domain-containing protein [Halobacteriales archaeon]